MQRIVFQFSGFLLLFFLFLSPINAHPRCTEIGGSTQREFYNSAILKIPMSYSVYLPPCYDPLNQRYPVIYLLHGSNEDDGHWLRLGLKDLLDQKILRLELPPVIVLMPFGNTPANENRFDQFSWANVFLSEFMPLAESHYAVDARRETRAIGGISRGGFWAYHIAFTYPLLFSAVGGHSAFFDRYHAAPEFNPLDLASSALGLDTLRVYLDYGAQDYAQDGLKLMHERLTARGLEHTYVVNSEGQHANNYWSKHLLEYMQFYTAFWDIPPAASLPPLDLEQGAYLLLPVVSFPSLQANISLERLRAVADSQSDAKLILAQDTAETLRDFGVVLSKETRIVDSGAVHNLLWADRTAYTLLPFDQLSPRYRVLNLVTEDGEEIGPLDSDLLAYPMIFGTGTPNFYPNQLTRILFSGVTALTRGTMDALDNHGVAWAAEALAPYVHRPDFFHTSSEVSFYPTCPQTDDVLLADRWSFCGKREHFDLFTLLGVDIVELTGNHNNDYGFQAYLDTLAFYREAGIQTVGGGATLHEARQPLTLQHHGNTVSLVACNWAGPAYALANDERQQPGAAYCEWDWLKHTLPQLAQESDVLVVTVQFEEREEYVPSSKQQTAFRSLADLGADVVIGTQAHKPQTFEFYRSAVGKDTFIHYGLGNLFFDQDFWGNKRFFMDELYVYQERLLTVNLFTGIIDDLARPRAMTHDERENFLYFMLIQQNGF